VVRLQAHISLARILVKFPMAELAQLKAVPSNPWSHCLSVKAFSDENFAMHPGIGSPSCSTSLSKLKLSRALYVRATATTAFAADGHVSQRN
jgi:hypothetical protein